MMKPLITLEGLDGAGKTTQIRHIDTYLESLGQRVYTTRQPGGTVLGESVRGILRANTVQICDVSELLLFGADRAQHSVFVRGMLQDHIVVCDRFSDSTIAYQGYGRRMDLDLIEQINLISLQGLVPDLTFFIDISPDLALARREFRVADRIESENRAFFERVRNGYHAIAQAEPWRVVVIDGSGTEKEVFSQIVRSLDSFLESRI